LDGLIAVGKPLAHSVEDDLSHLAPPYPFTAPAVSPATMRRWKNRTKMMIGTVTITAAAAMLPVGAVNCEVPVKNASAAGTVRALFEEVRVIAKRKSFQQKMKTRIAAVNVPGAASGRMILRNAWNGVAPST